jgi:putative aminopeptidase FrvX
MFQKSPRRRPLSYANRRESSLGSWQSGLVLAVLAFFPNGHSLSAQAAPSDADLTAMASWVAVDMATGYETRLAPALARGLEGWSADPWGNLVLRVGSGSPRRVVACALDRPSLAVTRITDDGYLRVHRIGSGSRHPLWDQAFEAQQVRIFTPTGPVTGVVARSNGHFAAQHRNETAVVRADDLWIDVGATSRDDVAALGIGLLDPVARELPAWHLIGEVAGPDAGRRVGCAAVATLAARARQSAPAGETTFVLSGQEVFGWVGLSSLIARGGAFDQVVILAPGDARSRMERRARTALGRFGAVLQDAGVDSVTWIAPAVRSPGSHMEAVTAAEAGAVLQAGARALGMSNAAGARWVAAPAPAALRTNHADASLARVADVLTNLVERYAVPGHEWSVRRYVLESLPAWARERAVVDGIGNIVVEAGPERDTTVFMAHMDEVGYEVEAIAPDGIVSLASRGGVTATAWEGQTALLHFDPEGAPSTEGGDASSTDPRWKAQSLTATAPEPLRGVFLTRDEADEKSSPDERAWFGLDAAGLEARGVRVGAQVTSHKEGLRMGRHRFVGRGLDDRAGTTALILAINAIDPNNLPGKVIFAWSVSEEGGLVGAGAMARRFARSARRIYSVDTFVSSDTPLESPHFAYAPLGNGPVLRAIENSAASPDRERARVFAAAERAGIPLQMGLTQGGTDGSTFMYYGAPNQGLSWPGRYSHSPGEVLDLRDLDRLGKLIAAVAMAPGR